MIATGERPKKKDILQDLDLKRRALLLDSEDDLLDDELEPGAKDDVDSADADRFFFDEDDDEFDYDYERDAYGREDYGREDYGREDYGRDYSPGYDDYGDAEEPCPELEPSGSVPAVRYEDVFREDSFLPDEEDEGELDAGETQYEDAEGRPVEDAEETVYEDAEEKVRDSEEMTQMETLAVESENGVEDDGALESETTSELEARRHYEAMAELEVAAHDICLDEEERGDLQTSDAHMEKELSPSIEVSPAKEDSENGGSNMVEPMAIQTATDESGSDVTGDYRAKLSLMKTEAAQRLDDLEKLIDEHQEIVEELKRTESSQGSLVDLASGSHSPSPVPFPAATTPVQHSEPDTSTTPELEARPYETAEDDAVDAAYTEDPASEGRAEQYTPEPLAVPDPADDNYGQDVSAAE